MIVMTSSVTSDRSSLDLYANASEDIDSGHHAVILVLEIVAVQQVPPLIAAPFHDHLNLFAILDSHRIFPASLAAERRTAVTAKDLERSQVYMHRMQHRAANKGPIHKAPHFNVTKPGSGIDPHRVEHLIVNHPLHSGRYP